MYRIIKIYRADSIHLSFLCKAFNSNQNSLNLVELICFSHQKATFKLLNTYKYFRKVLIQNLKMFLYRSTIVVLFMTDICIKYS